MVSYRDLHFTAETLSDRPTGKRFNLYVNSTNDHGRGELFGTLRQIFDAGWNITSDDNSFKDFANENVVMWCYARKNNVHHDEVLFVCKASYIMFYHREELRYDKLMIDAAFLHGTKKDLAEALRL